MAAAINKGLLIMNIKVKAVVAFAIGSLLLPSAMLLVALCVLLSESLGIMRNQNLITGAFYDWAPTILDSSFWSSQMIYNFPLICANLGSLGTYLILVNDYEIKCRRMQRRTDRLRKAEPVPTRPFLRDVDLEFLLVLAVFQGIILALIAGYVIFNAPWFMVYGIYLMQTLTAAASCWSIFYFGTIFILSKFLNNPFAIAR